MSEKKPDVANVEDAMACAAFNEAGLPCPGAEEAETTTPQDTDTACAAYHAQAMDCPVDTEK